MFYLKYSITCYRKTTLFYFILFHIYFILFLFLWYSRFLRKIFSQVFLDFSLLSYSLFIFQQEKRGKSIFERTVTWLAEDIENIHASTLPELCQGRGILKRCSF